MLTLLTVNIWIARYLGPEKYGVLNYILAFISLFFSISSLGLDSIIIRDLVKYPENKYIYMGTSFWLRVMGSFLSFLIIFITNFFIHKETQIFIFVTIVAIANLFQVFNIIEFYFQSKVLGKIISICKILQLIVSSLIKVFLLIIKANLFWFVFEYLINQILLTIFQFIAYIYEDKKNINFFKYFNIHKAKIMLKDGLPLLLAGISVTVYMRIDQVMIKYMLTEKDVGLYSVSVKLSELWYFIPSILVSSLAPALINAKKVSNELYYQRLSRFYSLMWWLAISVGVIINIFSKLIIKILYGEDFIESSYILNIYIWASIPVFLGMASSQYLINENYTDISLYRSIIGGIVNVILNLILIPLYGIKGAALATLISYSITTGFIVFIPKTSKHFFLMIKAVIPKL